MDGDWLESDFTNTNMSDTTTSSTDSSTGGGSSFADIFTSVTTGTATVLNAVSSLFGKEPSSSDPMPTPETYGSASTWTTTKILMVIGGVLLAITAIVVGIKYFGKKK